METIEQKRFRDEEQIIEYLKMVVNERIEAEPPISPENIEDWEKPGFMDTPPYTLSELSKRMYREFCKMTKLEFSSCPYCGSGYFNHGFFDNFVFCIECGRREPYDKFLVYLSTVAGGFAQIMGNRKIQVNTTLYSPDFGEGQIKKAIESATIAALKESEFHNQ